MEDSFKHKGQRQKLVDELRKKGISDEKVLEAIGKVPRHLFMESGFDRHAYQDKAFPIGAGQTISQPYTVAFQTMLLDTEPHMKVLEVGTGSGYQAAILIEMGVKVFTIERQRELYLKAQDFLPEIGYKPRFFYGDGYEGLPSYAPFDRIIVTAGAPDVPQNLVKQLKINGKMVVPVGSKTLQDMILVVKSGDGDYHESRHGGFVFVPLLKGRSAIGEK
ncbi:MAG: protein-L-isoaspartate(D-aspartate) O-methyltransferase [Bacteroidales bacterium]